jgi:hypothetical protein
MWRPDVTFRWRRTVGGAEEASRERWKTKEKYIECGELTRCIDLVYSISMADSVYKSQRPQGLLALSQSFLEPLAKSANPILRMI